MNQVDVFHGADGLWEAVAEDGLVLARGVGRKVATDAARAFLASRGEGRIVSHVDDRKPLIEYLPGAVDAGRRRTAPNQARRGTTNSHGGGSGMSIREVPAPGERTTNVMWIVLVAGLLAIALASFIAAFFLSTDGCGATACSETDPGPFFTIGTSSLTGLIGIFVSPGKGSGSTAG